MPECPRIAVSQLVLWYDATRIQAWPELLARVPADAVFSSPTELGKRFATDRMTDDRHTAAEKITRNLAGLELVRGRWVLRGVGLIAHGSEGYRVTREGLDLARAYREKPSGIGWAVALAVFLLTREPRTRAMMRLLSEPGARLLFDGGWFAGSLRRSVIERPDGSAVHPFVSHAEGMGTLGDALADNPWWCLGAWRDELRAHGIDACVLVGIRRHRVSLHDIGLALRASCEVLRHVGVLCCETDKCTVRHEVARRIFPSEIADDFGWESRELEADGPMAIIAEVLSDLCSDTGYVVASDLREVLVARGIDDPDRQIAELERTGQIFIYAEDYGQQRHGRGLYGDPRKQLIKLRIVDEGART